MRAIYLLTLFFSLLLSTSSGWALGLGEITVSSKLGEKFNASVPITDSTTLNSDQIIAKNAPSEIYQQLQIDNSFTYQSFNLVISKQGEELILIISSNDTIKEPYLNFVLQLKWPEGQLNKEYKVLIDP